METKTKSLRWLLPLLSALFLLSGLTACDSTEGAAEEKPDKPKPNVPVADGDWQIVPATGGTITKDNLSITFSSGTFAEDAKVAITEVQASKIVGDKARSKFYQVILPSTGTLKAFTVKFKCEGSTDNQQPVLTTPGWDKHTGEFTDLQIPLKSNVKNGEIFTTIDKADSNNEENPFFIIGLTESVPIIDSNTTRAGEKKYYDYKIIPSNYSDQEIFKKFSYLLVDNIPLAFDILESLNFHNTHEITYTVKKYVKDTIIPGTSPIFSKEDDWGVFVGSKFFKSLGAVFFNENRIRQYFNNPDESMFNSIRQTLIHETLHAFTYYNYDPRLAIYIAIDGANGDDWAQFDEAVGCWTEQFIGDKKISENIVVYQNLFIREFYPHERSASACQFCGYGMGAFVDFLARKTSNQSIVKLYEKLKEGAGHSVDFIVVVDFRHVLKNFLFENNIEFFDNISYYDFVFSILNNQFHPEITIDHAVTPTFMKKDNGNTIDILMKEKEITFSEEVYNWGALVQKLPVSGKLLRENEDSVIHIKQNNEGVLTRVYYKKKNNNIVEIGKCNKDASLTITVKDFCKLFGIDVKEIQSPTIYFSTIREVMNSDYSSLPSEITVEIKRNNVSVEPDTLEFSAEGGTQKLKVTAQGYKRFGCNIAKEYSSWLKAKAISGGTVEITAQPNDTGKERKATIKCYVTNEENATDDQKVFMPVTIVQKANRHQLEEIELYFVYEIAGITEIVPDKQGIHWYSNKNEIVISGGHITCSWKNTYNSYNILSFDIDDMNKLKSKAARISDIKGEGKTYNENGKLLNQWNISANCQTTNSSHSEDGITYYGWDWGKNSFYVFSGSGPGWTPSTIDLSGMSDAYGYISIKYTE